MPRTREAPERMNVRLPKPLVDEVDRICHDYKSLSYNRQQFIETAVREQIRTTLSIPQGKVKHPAKGKTPSSA